MALPVRLRSPRCRRSSPPRPDAAKRFLTFFAAQTRNPNSRKAYFRAVSRCRLV
jgi:hypothetical protein